MMLKRHTYRSMVLMALLALSACGVPSRGTSNIAIEGAWVRAITVAGAEDAMSTMPAMSGSMQHGGSDAPSASPAAAMASGVTGGAYLTIRNTGSAADQLLRVSTDVAEVVELHTTVIENNVAQMQPVATIDVPANGQVEFKSGSYHLMLINVNRTLQVGDTVPITFTFQNAGDVQVVADVRAF